MLLYDQQNSASRTAQVFGRLYLVGGVLFFLLGFSEITCGLFPLAYGPLFSSIIIVSVLHWRVPLNFRKMLIKPAVIALMFSPFPTWYMHYAIDTPYISACLLLYAISIAWLIYASIKQLQLVAIVAENQRMTKLMSWTLRLFVYIGVLPFCFSILAGLSLLSASGRALTLLLLNQEGVFPFPVSYYYAATLLLCSGTSFILQKNLQNTKRSFDEESCLQLLLQP